MNDIFQPITKPLNQLIGKLGDNKRNTSTEVSFQPKFTNSLKQERDKFYDIDNDGDDDDDMDMAPNFHNDDMYLKPNSNYSMNLKSQNIYLI